MRSTVIDGEEFFVFQDVCRELGCRKSLRFVSRENRDHALIPVPTVVQSIFNVVNAAGIEELRKGLELESSHADPKGPKETRSARRKA